MHKNILYHKNHFRRTGYPTSSAKGNSAICAVPTERCMPAGRPTAKGCAGHPAHPPFTKNKLLSTRNYSCRGVLLGMTFSSIHWKTINKAGTMKSSATVPINIPPTVPTPTEILPLAPTPVANIMGSIPNIMVSEVIRIGRRRSRQG